VVWSLAYSSSEDSRLEEAESTLARMQRYLGGEGTPPAQAPLRIRMDRLILLNRLGRHAGARGSPGTAGRRPHPARLRAAAVGDSLMGTLHRRSHSGAAGGSGRRPDARRLAFGTGLRLPGKRAAGKGHRPAAGLARQGAAWRWSNGKSPYANWSRYEADLNLAMVRAYSGDLRTAQHDLESMVDIAPATAACRVRWAACT
jgi:biofilm PGA synthesis protein PgaA